MNGREEKKSYWIQSPRVDLFFFSFGWILIFLAFYGVDQTSFARSGRWVLVGLTLLLTVFHRHLTFPLVYGDPKTLQSRKRTYLLLPIIFLVITTGTLLYVRSPSFLSKPVSQPLAITKGEGLKLLVYSPKGVERIPLEFSGEEKTLGEVALAFQQALRGEVLVQAQGDQLKFTPLPSTKGTRIAFRDNRGSKLRQQLGLPLRSFSGYKAERPLFIVLLVLSGLWNIYHTLMQKMGILRIYGRKTKGGKSWLDKSMVWIWFGYLFFLLGTMPQIRRQVARAESTGKFLNAVIEPILPLVPYLAKLFLILSLAVTVFYLKEELTARGKFNWPKNLFMLSILMIYATFLYNFLVGFIVFGFSHAVEYLAFVTVYSKKKYLKQPIGKSLMARWMRHHWLYFILFLIVSSALFIPWYFIDRSTLTWYIVGSSFLHFLYDGWIWKVRKPEVGEPLGIEYEKRPGMQPA